MENSGVKLPPRTILGLLGLTLLAATLRFWRLDQAGLWLDETMSWWFARADWSGLVAGLRQDSGPPGYYLLLKLWMTSWDDSEWSLRSLSAALGAALVPALWWVGCRMVGERAAWLAAGLAAVSPIAVRYGQEARGYTLLPLLCLGASYGFWRWLQEGRPRHLGLGAGALLAALYVHYYAGFLAGGMAAAGLLSAVFAKSRVIFRRLAMGLGLVALGYAPWLPELLRQMKVSSPVAWMGEVWRANGAWGSLQASLAALSPGAVMPPYLDLPSLPTPWATFSSLVMLFVLCSGLVSLARDVARSGVGLWLGLTLFGPLAAALAYSVVSRPVYLPGRLDQLVLPACCLVVGWGLAAVPRRLGLPLALALALLSLATLATYFRSTPAEPGEREIAARIAELARPGDFVLTTSLSGAPLAYYLRHEPLALQSFPAELALHPGNEEAASFASQPTALEAEARALVEDWERRGARGFVAFVPNPTSSQLFAAVRDSSGLAEANVEEGYQQRLLAQPLTLLRLSWLRPAAPGP